MNGVINVFKNKGMSSFDVVRIVKKVANTKKVGHTGTLDPEASGVLPICIGKATKIIDYIMTAKKSYYVKFQLGLETTTYDLEGDVVSRKDITHLDNNMIIDAIMHFKGEYIQVPPMYSALKKNGVRLYDLARQGIEIDREGRKINIFDIRNIEIEMPYVSMEVTCSKGTYIRSLCYDIGNLLKVSGTVTELKRTMTASFREEDSININDLNEENINKHIISIDEALNDYPKLSINKGYSKLLINGVNVYDKRLTDNKIEKETLYKVYDENNNFIGLGKLNYEGFKMEKLLVI